MIPFNKELLPMWVYEPTFTCLIIYLMTIAACVFRESQGLQVVAKHYRAAPLGYPPVLDSSVCPIWSKECLFPSTWSSFLLPISMSWTCLQLWWLTHFEFMFLASLLFEKPQHLVSSRAMLILSLLIVDTPTHSRTGLPCLHCKETASQLFTPPLF